MTSARPGAEHFARSRPADNARGFLVHVALDLHHGHRFPSDTAPQQANSPCIRVLEAPLSCALNALATQAPPCSVLQPARTANFNAREWVPSSAHFVFCVFASNGPREPPASPPDRPRLQTCAALSAQRVSGALLLPKFSTSAMIKESGAWTHEFKDRLNPLRHYQFRRHFLDKCRLLSNTLVICSEMYTSRTCARCCRLHVNLQGSADVFQCPHCDFRAGRDENAAFNSFGRGR